MGNIAGTVSVEKVQETDKNLCITNRKGMGTT